MAFNGSGTYVRSHDWTTDLGNAVPVTASRMDTEDDGFATGLSNTICRDGQSTTTARIPFASGLSAAAGTTASVAYAQTSDNNTGLYFPAADQWGLVAGGTATITSTSTTVTVPVAFAVTGATTLSSSLALTGDLAINTNKFTVTASSGNTLIAGTASITGDVAVNTNKFTVAASSGNTAIAGTLGVTGATTLSSTLASGNTTITGTLAASGNVAINTDKFTVTAASGNTAVAGTLAVTGASTLTGATSVTGALTANNAAGVAARNTAKAFAFFTTDGSAVVTVQASFNVTSIATATVGGQNGFRVTLTNALSAATYTPIITAAKENALTTNCVVACRSSDQTTTTLDFVITTIGTGVQRTDMAVRIAIFENA